MSEEVELICPKCKFHWQQSLEVLEVVEIIFKSGGAGQRKKIEKYRARCPNDGTYIIFEVAEEGGDG